MRYQYNKLGVSNNDFLFSQEFTQRIQQYEEICDEVNFLRRMIPLNLICLNCCEINDQIYDMVDELRRYIVDYFVNENRTHNRK